MIAASMEPKFNFTNLNRTDKFNPINKHHMISHIPSKIK